MEQEQMEQEDLSALAALSIPETVACGSTLFFLTLIFMGGILASGVMLGLITSLGLGIILWECRTFSPKIYDFIVQHNFATDLVASVLFFGLLGMSVNGLIAGAVFSICMSNILLLCNKYDPRAKGTKVKPLDSLFSFVKSKLNKKKTNVVPKEEKEIKSTTIEAEWRTVA